jgi:hypothetical protein
VPCRPTFLATRVPHQPPGVRQVQDGDGVLGVFGVIGGGLVLVTVTVVVEVLMRVVIVVVESALERARRARTGRINLVGLYMFVEGRLMK